MDAMHLSAIWVSLLISFHGQSLSRCTACQLQERIDQDSLARLSFLRLMRNVRRSRASRRFDHNCHVLLSSPADPPQAKYEPEVKLLALKISVRSSPRRFWKQMSFINVIGSAFVLFRCPGTVAVRHAHLLA